MQVLKIGDVANKARNSRNAVCGTVISLRVLFGDFLDEGGRELEGAGRK